ncbi:hypothetical protein [uncultured Arsenicicoccus sp.]|nr:hypothetical protein [uncultured Arsenicicoccus sp.]
MRRPAVAGTFYTLDEHGIVQVRITDLDTGYSQTYALRADG